MGQLHSRESDPTPFAHPPPRPDGKGGIPSLFTPSDQDGIPSLFTASEQEYLRSIHPEDFQKFAIAYYTDPSQFTQPLNELINDLWFTEQGPMKKLLKFAVIETSESFQLFRFMVQVGRVFSRCSMDEARQLYCDIFIPFDPRYVKAAVFLLTKVIDPRLLLDVHSQVPLPHLLKTIIQYNSPCLFKKIIAFQPSLYDLLNTKCIPFNNSEGAEDTKYPINFSIDFPHMFKHFVINGISTSPIYRIIKINANLMAYRRDKDNFQHASQLSDLGTLKKNPSFIQEAIINILQSPDYQDIDQSQVELEEFCDWKWFWDFFQQFLGPALPPNNWDFIVGFAFMHSIRAFTPKYAARCIGLFKSNFFITEDTAKLPIEEIVHRSRRSLFDPREKVIESTKLILKIPEIRKLAKTYNKHPEAPLTILQDALLQHNLEYVQVILDAFNNTNPDNDIIIPKKPPQEEVVTQKFTFETIPGITIKKFEFSPSKVVSPLDAAFILKKQPSRRGTDPKGFNLNINILILRNSHIEIPDRPAINGTWSNKDKIAFYTFLFTLSPTLIEMINQPQPVKWKGESKKSYIVPLIAAMLEKLHESPQEADQDLTESLIYYLITQQNVNYSTLLTPYKELPSSSTATSDLNFPNMPGRHWSYGIMQSLPLETMLTPLQVAVMEGAHINLEQFIIAVVDKEIIS